ncbi:MAG: Maf family protein [Pseudomonadota bacterium]
MKNGPIAEASNDLTHGRLVLASASSARQSLLKAAGLAFEVAPANIDEGAIRTALAADGGGLEPADLAELLARAKAEQVSLRKQGALVLGGDQVLVCDDTWYEKPADMDAARRQLLDLRGKAHQLHSAAVLARSGSVVWETVTTVDVVMRSFSPEFVGRYLAHVGDTALQSVGAYQLEGVGIQLIEEIRGDYFSVLGLPLFDVLAALRREGVIDA